MDQKNSNTLKYKSLSTGQPCNAAQYAAELVCIRKRQKENCGSLEFKFWNKSQKDEYQTQIRVASNLISKYSESALIRYLNSPSGNNIYALGFLHKSKKFVLTLKFVEKGVKDFYNKLEEESKREKKIIEAPKGDYKPKKPRGKNSLFSKIRKIDGTN
jgi:hypothetical protein